MRSRAEILSGSPLPGMKRRSRQASNRWGDERFAGIDEAELGRRAPHVECEQVFVPGPLPEPGGGDGPRRRAGLEHPHREPPRLVDVREPPAREHEEEPAPDPVRGDPFRELLDVAVGERHQAGVGVGGREPFELADLRRDLRLKSRTRRRGTVSARRAPRPAFVLRVGIAWRKPIATASTPLRASPDIASSSERSSSGATTSPFAPIRSAASSRRSRGTSGGGLAMVRS